MGLIYENTIALANKIAGEDVSADYPCTIAGAIDAVADQLAGSNVDSQGSIAGALGTLGEYIDGGGGSTTTTVYLYEMLSGQTRQPGGTVKVNGTSIQSSSTVSIDGMTTAYGYEVPLGAVITYELPSGYVVNEMNSPTFVVYQSIEEMEADGDLMAEFTPGIPDATKFQFMATSSTTPTLASCEIVED